MNNYLRTGHKSGGDGCDETIAHSSNGGRGSGSNNCAEVNHDNDCDMIASTEQQQQQHQQSECGEESSALTEMKMITSNQPKIAIDMDNVLKVIENAENGKKSTKTGHATLLTQTNHLSSDEAAASTSNSHNSSQLKESNKRGAVTGPDPTKPLQPKAKLLRQQRKAEKLLAKANASPTIAAATATVKPVPAPAPQKKLQKNMEKALKSFIDETPTDGKHKLKVNER